MTGINGDYTRQVYQLVADENYQEVVKIMEMQQHTYPNATAIHSLMGFCYFQLEDFTKASACYQRLVELNPKNDTYKLHLANCLYKTEQYHEAMTMTFGIQAPELKHKATILRAAIRYAEEDMQSTKAILSENDPEDLDIMVDSGIILFKEDRFQEALDTFMDVKRIHGFIPEVAYNIALCYYRLDKFTDAFQIITEIKAQASRDYPELLRSVAGDTVDYDAQGLLQKAHGAYLVEALNLVSAMEYDQKHYSEAKEALRELPNRSEEDLDPITLHNSAIVTMQDNPNAAFTKLTYLLGQGTVPETFRNLLLGYCKFEYYSAAADLLAENTELASKTMGKDMLEFLDALLMSSSSKEEAFREFDRLCKIQADILRRLIKQIDDARRTQDQDLQVQLTLEFERAVNELVPILMNQAKIFWDMKNYKFVELLLTKYMDFCLDSRTWKMNLAHAYFMQESKMEEAIQFYEPLVLSEPNLLDVEAIVVSNLSVAYVVLNENARADTIINRLTEEEEEKLKTDDTAKMYHLAILHLVIGTLYCAHHNFDFGLDYVLKAFKPMHQKLNPDTWYYAKKCLTEVIRRMSLRQYVIADQLFSKVIQFLDDVAKEGKTMESTIDLTTQAEDAQIHQTVSYEARTLKAMFLRMFHY